MGTCLWFNGRAGEAANFYVGQFPNCRVGEIAVGFGGARRSGAGADRSVRTRRAPFRGFNRGPEFTFTEAISFELFVGRQEELDEKWAELAAGGGEECTGGWLRDGFGVSWQLHPTLLPAVLNGPAPRVRGGP